MTLPSPLTSRTFFQRATNTFFRLIESNALVLVLLVLFSVTLFQDGLLDYPRNDHLVYLKHKEKFQNPVDWCKFSASYSRARWLQKGDEYLFRPAHMLSLCAEDVFFDTKPMVTGTISVVSAGIAAFILFLICSVLLKSRAGGLLASLCWLTFFPGFDLIIWRHISPYMFSLIFGFGGIYYFYGNTTHPPIIRHTIATALFLSASLFNEISFIALVIFIAIKFLLNITNHFKHDHNLELRRTFISILPALLAILTFIVLDILDFMKYGSSFLSPVDKFLNNGYMDFLWRSSSATIHLIALSIFALLFPFDVSIVYDRNEHIAWAFQTEGIYIFFLWFCATCGVAIISTGSYLLFKTKRSLQFHSLVKYSLCFLVSGFLSVGFLRGGMRGLEYFQHGTYYHSFYTWCWVIVLSFLLRYATDNSTPWLKGRKFLTVTGPSLLAAIYIGVNFYLTTDFIKTEYKPRATQYWASHQLKLFKKPKITTPSYFSEK